MRYRMIHLGQGPMPLPGANPTTPIPSPGKSLCITVGPVSAPDPKKIADFLQAQPPGTFWLYPRTEIGPGDQDYVVWCNAFAKPVSGATPWSPSAPATPAAAPSGTPPVAASPAPMIAGGIAAAGLLVFLAFR